MMIDWLAVCVEHDHRVWSLPGWSGTDDAKGSSSLNFHFECSSILSEGLPLCFVSINSFVLGISEK